MPTNRLNQLFQTVFSSMGNFKLSYAQKKYSNARKPYQDR